MATETVETIVKISMIPGVVAMGYALKATYHWVRWLDGTKSRVKLLLWMEAIGPFALLRNRLFTQEALDHRAIWARSWLVAGAWMLTAFLLAGLLAIICSGLGFWL